MVPPLTDDNMAEGFGKTDKFQIPAEKLKERQDIII